MLCILLFYLAIWNIILKLRKLIYYDFFNQYVFAHIFIFAFLSLFQFCTKDGRGAPCPLVCMDSEFEIVPGIKTPVSIAQSEQELKIGSCEESTELSGNYCNESSLVRSLCWLLTFFVVLEALSQDCSAFNFYEHLFSFQTFKSQPKPSRYRIA